MLMRLALEEQMQWLKDDASVQAVVADRRAELLLQIVEVTSRRCRDMN
jgi:hypothetical protein